LIVTVIDPDNCLFRTVSSKTVTVVRQVVLLGATVIFLLVQSFLAPHMNPINNASEWMSRASYVVTSTLALLVALDIPGKHAFSGIVLYMWVLPRL
jgi:hypothetical protein